jgi:murein L,D-transpeptidase YafK
VCLCVYVFCVRACLSAVFEVLEEIDDDKVCACVEENKFVSTEEFVMKMKRKIWGERNDTNEMKMKWWRSWIRKIETFEKFLKKH